MSGSPIPNWLGVVLGAVDLLHKATHPSRWGEEKRWREEEERKLRERDEHEGWLPP